MEKNFSADTGALCLRARELFDDRGYACSETVFTTLCEAVDERLAATCVSFATGFRGGMSSGDVCGAISGAVMAMGLLLAPPEPGGPSPELSEAVKLLRAKFEERYGLLDCGALLEKFPDKEDPARRDFCESIVDFVVETAAEIMKNPPPIPECP